MTPSHAPSLAARWLSAVASGVRSRGAWDHRRRARCGDARVATQGRLHGGPLGVGGDVVAVRDRGGPRETPGTSVGGRGSDGIQLAASRLWRAVIALPEPGAAAD